MEEIHAERLLLRPFRKSDYDDLFEFLSQLADDEFEGYPGITYENGREHLKYRLGSEEFYAMELTESGKVIGNIYCGNRDFAAREVGYIVNKRYQQTKDLYGTLRDYLPEASRKDEINYVKFSLGNLYHELCHRYIHAPRDKNVMKLRGTCKGLFFRIQNLHYLEKRQICPDKKRAERTCFRRRPRDAVDGGTAGRL